MTEGENLKKEKVIIRRSGWMNIFAAIIVLGSIMSFGLVNFFTVHLTRETSIYMLGMITPMSILMFFELRLMVRHIEAKMNPLLDGIQQVAGGNIDVKLEERKAGEYKEIYLQFNKMTSELRNTKTEMQNFVNEFAHEFKTPITSISGFADYLLEMGDEISKEERDEYLQIIAQQSQRLANLSQNTLLLSKVEACEILTDCEIFSLSQQLQQCVILLLKKLEEKNLSIELPEDMDISYYGNAELLEQVWINLLGNAIKYTPKGGKITIEAEKKEKIVVSISDTGCGMNETVQSHIFEKYYQNDTSSMVKGNGIGLSIAKRIVELSGGSICVSSVPEQGSTFTVIL